MKNDYLAQMREGKELSFRQQLLLIIQLSIPAVFAQLSSIVMQYIDASMVGRLGANDSAAIGLVSTSTWLFGGLCSAASIGFTVQVAQYIGAKDEKAARNVVRQGLVSVFLFSMILAVIAFSIHTHLPGWLGGDLNIREHASQYFLIYGLFLPVLQMNNTAGGMLQCSGNMKVPSLLHILMCMLDVIFNLLLIFPTRTVHVSGFEFKMYGADMGVAGAALGTGLAELVTMCMMLYALLARSPALHVRKGERERFSGECGRRAVRLAVPVGIEQAVMCGAYIMATKIIAPLGVVAIAANSFSVTAESLCYMPGYGIGSAATTIIGQSVGANRGDMARRLAWIATCFGMAIMAVSGTCMYLFAPWMIGLLSPDAAIRELGTEVLRIEAFAEPMYAASIVVSGALRGAGDTFVPSCMNFCSMWLVRLTLSAYLAPRMGLRGVWIAMCVELCVRGVMFLIRLAGKRWTGGRQEVV